MSYSLVFHSDAIKEWDKLEQTTRRQFKKKLAERLQNPHIPASRLAGYTGFAYKIKLRSSGHRLVYIVEDRHVMVIVLAVGKRERNQVYKSAQRRE